MERIILCVVIVVFMMSCDHHEVNIAKPTISKLISGKWDLTGIQNYDGGEIYRPTYPAVLEILVRDTTADFAYDEFGEYTSNGELHFINSDLFGNAASNESYSKTWQWIWNEFEHSLTDKTATYDFPITIYIVEASHNRLVLQVDGFPYWPKLFYKRHKYP